jgi:flagellar protein FlaG
MDSISLPGTSVAGVTNVSPITPVERKSESVDSSQKRSTDLNLQNIQTTQELRRAKSQGEQIPISEQQLIKAIDRAIKAMQGSETSLQFSVHKQTKQIMVKVLNKDTGEVIREIPPEKTLDIVAKLWEMAGIFVDERR